MVLPLLQITGEEQHVSISLTCLYDTGRVLDAAILPSTDDSEEGAWVLLTEKAGLWTIPERAVLLCGVVPPERSLSRKGSSKEGASDEEKRSVEFGVSIPPRRVSSEAWDAGNRQRVTFTGGPPRGEYDEKSEALLGRRFNDYLLTGQVDESFEKLKSYGVFDRDGETNVFCRASRSIVDTLAKQWTTIRGSEIVSLAVISSQLIDKQQKHQKYLQFLALSKCHEETCARQRNCLQIIMEHGEKLAAMIQLRDMQNNLFHSPAHDMDLSSPRSAGAVWDLIQAVGEKNRRDNVLLMDRNNAEVFYSKVSDVEEDAGETDVGGIKEQKKARFQELCVPLFSIARRHEGYQALWPICCDLNDAGLLLNFM